MPFIVCLLVAVPLLLAYNWIDDRLTANGLQWSNWGIGAALFAALVIVGAAQQGWENLMSPKVKAAPQKRKAVAAAVAPPVNLDTMYLGEGEVVLAEGLNAPVEIEYEGANGSFSDRTVTVRMVGGSRTRDGKAVPTRFWGWCDEAQALRNFKVASVHEARIPGTDHEIADLAAFLLAVPVASQPKAAQSGLVASPWQQ